jgi:hypothetical protein
MLLPSIPRVVLNHERVGLMELPNKEDESLAMSWHNVNLW